MSRQIQHEITIDRKIEEVFDALITPSQIKKWWFAKTAIVLPEVDGFYAATWGEKEDEPDYISFAKISEFNRPFKFKLNYEKYFSKDGPLSFDAKLDTEFILEKSGDKTKLKVVQSGFPETAVADEFYQGCIKGWTDTFNSLKNVLENN